MCTDFKEQELRPVDWYAPNVPDNDLGELIEGKDHPLLRILGGITGIVQVLDVKAHGPLSLDSFAVLRAGYPAPPVDRNIVMKRVYDAWHSIGKAAHTRGFVEVGMAGDLFGDDDW